MVGVNVTTSGYRAWMFALLWTTYGSSYLVRKPLGVIKADLAADLVLDRARRPPPTLLLDAGLSSLLLIPCDIRLISLGRCGSRWCWAPWPTTWVRGRHWWPV